MIDGPPTVDRVPNPIIGMQTRIIIANPRPISVNKAYTVYQGRKRLTKKGKAYKDAVRAQVAGSTYQWKAAHQGVFHMGGYIDLHITAYLESLYNASWKPGAMTKPKARKDGTKPKPQPRSPYQQVDVGNFLKLLEDGIVSGSGIDDQNHLDIHLYKREDAKYPRVEVLYRVMIPS